VSQLIIPATNLQPYKVTQLVQDTWWQKSTTGQLLREFLRNIISNIALWEHCALPVDGSGAVLKVIFLEQSFFFFNFP
jgi:hypothetical protein